MDHENERDSCEEMKSTGVDCESMCLCVCNRSDANPSAVNHPSQFIRVVAATLLSCLERKNTHKSKVRQGRVLQFA